MRSFAILVGFLCAGCGGITSALIDSLVGDMFPEVTVYEPSPETAAAPRLAFLAHGEGGVACYILDGGGTDPIMDVGTEPNGIAVGTSGAIFVSTEDQVIGLDARWGEVNALPTDVTAIDDVAADAGVVVVAARTDEGAVVLVYDEISHVLIGQSEPVPGVTVESLAVGNGVAFAVESSGAIVSYDLATPVPAREPVADSGELSGEPVAIVVDDTGNILVAGTEGRVEEVDVLTGEVVDTRFVFDPAAPPVDLAFDPGRDLILLLTADDVVRVIDEAGRVVEQRESPSVQDATAIAFFER